MYISSNIVNPPETIALALFLVVLLILASAAISDIRTREVHDGHWIAIGLAGIIAWIAISVYQGIGWEHIAIAAGSGIIIFDVLWDSDRSIITSALIYGSIFVLFLLPYMLSPSNEMIQARMMIPVFYVIYMLMYMAGILRGGADAKCMISLTVAFPLYIEFWHFPIVAIPDGVISEVFVFSLTVLFYALLFSLLTVIYFIYRNFRDGNTGRRIVSGYMMDIDDAEDSYVWPMDDVGENGLYNISIPEHTYEIYERLREHGEKRIWVTPMIPFIFPLFVAFLFTGIVGNVLFLI
jgi:preflagellin peptidase FlaK